MAAGHFSQKEALDEVRRTIKGIDIDEYDSDIGWWETSDGARFGAEKLAEVEALVRSLVSA